MKEIFEHRSVRSYTKEKVSDHVLLSILNAALRASNTGNMQLVSIIVTRNAEQKRRLAPAHFNQPMVVDADIVLTFCADVHRMNRWCELRDAEHGFMNLQTLYSATIDATIAAQNAALEAEHYGLGICYLGTTTYNAGQIVDILRLPQGVLPVTTITIGYPAIEPHLTERLPLNAVVHDEIYNDYSDKDINILFAERESLESNRQFCKENNKENLAQVFSEVRYSKANNEHFSEELLGVMRRQGFVI